MHITSTETQYAPPLEILLLKGHYAHGKCMGYHLIQANHFLGLPCEFLLVKKLEIEKTKTTFIIPVLKVVYSRVHKSWNSFFSKILEKPSIVQKNFYLI